MIKTDYMVIDDFKARQIYEKAIFYSKSGYEKDAKVTGFSADNINNQWREEVIEFTNLKTEARLRLHSYPNKSLNKKTLPKHSLHIKFFGREIESAKEKLEELTGVKLE